MKSYAASFVRLALAMWVGAVSLWANDPGAEPTAGERLFALKLQRLFAEKCNACHGDDPENIEGGFDMRSRDAMLSGGDSYGTEVLVPGKGDESFLYVATTRRVEDYEMPPKEAEKLTEEETWWIRDWIDAGAPWPDDRQIVDIQHAYGEREAIRTSGGLQDDWTNRRYQPEHLWAYRPLKVEEIPDSAHPVDWFVNRKLREIDLEPAPVARPRELARRISFSITGLPPDPKVIQTLEKSFDQNADKAVRDYVGQLMSSPHYGEHFASRWLDVARYADSAGFANDYSRPNAWRYRDYVVRSFNSDKRYDQFVREQIAGDELDSSDPESLIATGFLRMGPWEQTGMSVFRVTRQQWLDDVTDSVGQTFLAHALQCAKCHDHKFDPVPTRDYYSMMAVFTTTQFAERDAAFVEAENNAGFDQADTWTKAKVAAYQQQRNDLEKRVNEIRQAESGAAKVGDNALDPGDEASLARLSKNILRHRWELDKTKPIALGVYTGKTITRNNVADRIDLPAKPWKKGVMEPDTILTGGDAFSRGDEVCPAPLSAAENLGRMLPAEFADGNGKRRLCLANWIVDKSNPLTARVIVNRVWSWHFGKGIAANPNNFGATGALPTHPRLLDYLAHWFVKNDWSIKRLNELILTSETYRRSTQHPETATIDAKDPKRNFYATSLPRRLTAEEIRDAMLAASGELNRSIGGIPCRPDINWEVAMQPRQIMGGTASVYEPDPSPEQRNRRSLYAEKIRGLRDPFLETFNQPGPDKSCEMRETSTVAPQALTLFNAQEVHERALAFAARLMNTDQSDQEKIDQAFLLSLGRPTTNHERSQCLEHWINATTEESTQEYPIKEYETEVRRTVMAEKTGEPYEFVEVMPAFETYVPDLQPGQTDAKTRGLAQVCLVLFNLNEFAYVD